jgi:hypothetical protein
MVCLLLDPQWYLGILFLLEIQSLVFVGSILIFILVLSVIIKVDRLFRIIDF